MVANIEKLIVSKSMHEKLCMTRTVLWFWRLSPTKPGPHQGDGLIARHVENYWRPSTQDAQDSGSTPDTTHPTTQTTLENDADPHETQISNINNLVIPVQKILLQT